MGKLEGRVALVTGGSRGNGRAIAERFLAEGATVVVSARSLAGLEEIVESNRDRGEIVPVACDIGSRTDVLDLVTTAAGLHGGLDIVVSNAQGMGTQERPVVMPEFRPIAELDEAEWDYTLRAGPTATMLMMRAAFPYLKESGAGRLITVSSGSGVRGDAGSAPYNCAKEAIRALTRTAAREWGEHRITVNAISPVSRSGGFADPTPEALAKGLSMIPLGRLAESEEIAAACAFLVSDEGAFITGITLYVDGGRNIHA